MGLSTNNLTVLFVDDEPMARKYFERNFGRELNVRTAGNCEEARVTLADYGDRVAVLITDQRMPESDGVSLLSEVRANYPHIVRLLTTAYADIDQAIAAVNQGEIWRYITKPWDIEELRTILSTAMDVYRSRAYEQALLSERRRVMLMLANDIAHEMRAPLQTIQMAVFNIEQHLPALLESHDAGLEPVTKRDRQALEKSTNNVKRVVKRANSVIDLLLANADAYCSIDPSFSESCAIADCVAIALEDFPFTGDERDKVNWTHEPEFHFHGSVNLMVLILHNLLRNALRAVEAADQGEIYIWTAVHKGENALHVKDTGPGIP